MEIYLTRYESDYWLIPQKLEAGVNDRYFRFNNQNPCRDSRCNAIIESLIFFRVRFTFF